MDERVEKYIKEKEAEVKEKYEKEKEKKLVALGLFEKEYSPDGGYKEDFPCYDYDAQKYYKKVPIKITDEEYKEVLKYSGTSEQGETTTGNPFSVLLNVVAGIIFTGGFIWGAYVGSTAGELLSYFQSSRSEFSFMAALPYWAISIILGISFLGFAEIIKLLDEIKRK